MVLEPVEFEWDENKNRTNIEKHHISFSRAAKIFNSDVLEWEDARQDYGETRMIAIGHAEQRILRVAYTKRGNKIRIISGRFDFASNYKIKTKIQERRIKMTDENITMLSFKELPSDDESAWEQFDSMADEDENAVEDADNPPLTEEELNQFKRTFYVKGKKVWGDEKTIGEWLAEKGEIPTFIPIDNNIAEWFHSQGGDFKVQINAVLRDYVEAHR